MSYADNGFLMPLRLETDRLRLRPFAEGDWRAMHEHFGDAEATRHTFGRALTEAGTWRAVARFSG